MNYKDSTVRKLAQHFLTLTTQAITQRIIYYTRKGDLETVKKIKKARIVAKQLKLSTKLELLSEV